jgi:phosphatidate cytidylyltransferase
MLFPRILSSLVLWAVVLALVLSKFTEGAFLLIAAVGLLAQWEFYAMQEKRGWKVFKKAGLACGALLYVVTHIHLFQGFGAAGWLAHLELLLLILVILGALTRQIFEKEQTSAVVTVALTLFGFFYIPYLFNFVVKILYWPEQPSHGFYLIVYLIAVTKMTDVGAYAIGMLIGRHKMSPRISPKKTWEGFFGGIAIALLTGLALVHFLPDELGFLSGSHVWVLGLVLPIISVIGDLGESVIKRDSQSKDSGGFIPGIGGCLDLIDSLLFTAPVFYCYLNILFP